MVKRCAFFGIILALFTSSLFAQNNEAGKKYIERIRADVKAMQGKLPDRRNDRAHLLERTFIEPNILASTFELQEMKSDTPSQHRPNFTKSGDFQYMANQFFSSMCLPSARLFADNESGLVQRLTMRFGGQLLSRDITMTECRKISRESLQKFDYCDRLSCSEGMKLMLADRRHSFEEHSKAMRAAGKGMDLLQPHYPSAENLARIGGTCKVHSSVGSDGWPTSVEIKESTANVNLDRACLYAALYSKYPVRKQKGKAVRYTGSLHFEFKPYTLGSK